MAVSENNRKFAIGKQRLGIMVETNDRKLPVGIQSFEEIRKGGYLYVDKTDIIWQCWIFRQPVVKKHSGRQERPWQGWSR